MTIVDGRPGHGLQQALVGVSVVSLLVTIPHVLEDFVAGIPARFWLSVLLAGGLLAIGYVVHVIGIVPASHGSRWGYAINLLLGIG
ncbi:MAG: hypothetical protein NVS4B8_16910 [Herpetosiphon sp.]